MLMGVVGRRFALHASAAGKVLLAWLPEDSVEDRLRQPLERYTPATLTDPAALREELARTRERGYSVNWKELEEDLVSVAAPVWDHRGQLVAALSIAAPASRMPRSALAGAGGTVADAARRLSRALGCAGC
jgi:DNA-binding IclR family transcriptional regulator